MLLKMSRREASRATEQELKQAAMKGDDIANQELAARSAYWEVTTH